LGRGTPRNILKLAYYSLEHATDQGMDLIDEKEVLNANRDAGI